jgi:hypothetical protein
VAIFVRNTVSTLDPGSAPGLGSAVRKLAGIPNGLNIASARTVNKAATGGVTDAVRLIAAHYNLKQADIRKSIKIPRRATYSDPTAVLQATGFRSVSLRAWKPTPAPGGKRPPVGLRVKVIKGGAVKPAPGSFWMPVGGGAYTVMKRAGKDKVKAKKGKYKGRMREPLVKVWGPTFMAHYRKPDTQAKLKRQIADRLRVEMPRQVRYLLKTGSPMP